MKYYFAPMEGITGHRFREAHHTFFKGIDKYFTPFISPNKNRTLRSRELTDVLPEHNKGIYVVPQILTNQAEDFLWTADKLQQLGYEEVNLNLGCPSGTVVSKHKGAGFLEEPDRLCAFLEQIFSACSLKISIKTRIGMYEPEEFERLLQIYNQYPLEELIIHPRVREDYYKNKPNLQVFGQALQQSRATVCYNGDIFSQKDFEEFTLRFQEVNCVMLGRGLLANPGLVCELKTKEPMDKQTLKAFHDRVLAEYEELFSGDRNVLFKMKELWFYMIHAFDNPGKYPKKIRKAEKLKDYKQIVEDLFLQLEISENPEFQMPAS